MESAKTKAHRKSLDKIKLFFLSLANMVPKSSAVNYYRSYLRALSKKPHQQSQHTAPTSIYGAAAGGAQVRQMGPDSTEPLVPASFR
ncbi:uncharacterized protein LMH87_008053 [Akanthomyces muscarius]|uniref:Uncharacterized protein n=1 Tax=Akanthomyces muscarius TaxID=2231603 RepID=A0A9W8QIJ2_AKAMU|nr:uncharacterized protein LMH87_008053 [Akanthomyces muscarius]KAJ4159140.1 hypothetical protein LMH87_008053 [Akanthomyces muscarius]